MHSMLHKMLCEWALCQGILEYRLIRDARHKNSCVIEIKRKATIPWYKTKGDFFSSSGNPGAQGKRTHEDAMSSGFPEENLSRFPGNQEKLEPWMLNAWMQATWPQLLVGGTCQRDSPAMLPVIMRQMDIYKMNGLAKFSISCFSAYA